MPDSLSALVLEAESKCKEGRVINLILSGDFDISEIYSCFVNANEEKAQLWQKRVRPENLVINHGEYIHKYGDGIKFIQDELTNKPDSNRAVISLINGKDILYSGDRPIPSFMIIQFSFVTHTNIACTAYFRALEVSKFLPSNISEICLILRKLKEGRLSRIEKFSLTIHAFSAYANSDFYCLEVSEIDLPKNRGEVAIALEKKDYPKLLSFLNSKLRDESFICTDGLTELSNRLTQINAKDENNINFRKNIVNALKAMEKLQNLKKYTSNSPDVAASQNNIQYYLKSSIECVGKLMKEKS